MSKTQKWPCLVDGTVNTKWCSSNWCVLDGTGPWSRNDISIERCVKSAYRSNTNAYVCEFRSTFPLTDPAPVGYTHLTSYIQLHMQLVTPSEVRIAVRMAMMSWIMYLIVSRFIFFKAPL